MTCPFRSGISCPQNPRGLRSYCMPMLMSVSASHRSHRKIEVSILVIPVRNPFPLFSKRLEVQSFSKGSLLLPQKRDVSSLISAQGDYHQRCCEVISFFSRSFLQR